MFRRNRKLKDLEKASQEAEARLQAALAKREAIGAEARELQAKLRAGELGVVEQLEAERRLSKLKARYDNQRQLCDRLAQEAMSARQAYTDADRRLREARRVLGAIKNPPPWGLGDYSPATIRQVERQAKETIKELA